MWRNHTSRKKEPGNRAASSCHHSVSSHGCLCWSSRTRAAFHAKSGHTGLPDLYWQATCHRLKPRVGREPLSAARYLCHFQQWLWTSSPCRGGDPKGRFPSCPRPAEITACCIGTWIYPVWSHQAQARSSLSCTGRAGNPCSAMPGSLQGRGHLTTTSSEPPLGLGQGALTPACEPLCSLHPDIILKEQPFQQVVAWSTTPVVNDRASACFDMGNHLDSIFTPVFARFAEIILCASRFS